MFGSSSPFGASSPSPFGAPAATNPFGANPNPFGTNTQASNPFGAKPFGSTTPAFGAQTGSSLFGSGTSTGVFGATAAPAFGASSSAFGGSSTTPAFGAFGQQKPASPFGGFGATQPQQNPFGSPSFGQSQPAFGSQPFGSTSPGFGAPSAPAFGSTTTPLFGASTPAFGASSTPAFGSSPTPAFGAASSPAFGAASTPTFGASTSTPAFGASAPAFGGSSVFGQSAPAFGASTGLAFGSTPAASPFGAASGSAFGSSFGTSNFGGPQQQRVGSRVTPYTVTNDTDAGVGAQAGKFLCISAMTAYKDKQLEELRWEDYQAGDKGGPNPASTSQSAPGGIFGQQPPATSSPFGSGTATFGQTSTPNPFASTSTTNPFGATKPAFGNPAVPAPAFGASTPAFGSTAFGSSTNPFGTATAPAFGQTGSSPAFGSTPSPFGQNSASAFGNSTFGSSAPSLFGQSTPAFGSSSPAFGGAPSTPAFGSQTASAFGGGGLFGNTQPASSGGGLFGTSTPAFGASPAPAFGQSQAGFGTNLFGNTSTPGSIFGQTKPAGLTQSTPSSVFSGFGPTPAGQNPSAFSFANSQTPQLGATNTFGGTPSTFGAQNTFGQQQPALNVMSATQSPVTNPFGTLPAMPQITIGRSAGSGPSVQYGISNTPVSEKPTQVRVNTLLTPRHITQRSKVRMHARRYHPKRDGPKISFFSDGEEAPSTPKADVMFVPRENPRSLFIRQPEPSPITPPAGKSAPDVREIATPVQKDGFSDEIRDETTQVPQTSVPFSFPESPQSNWRSPDNGSGNGSVEAPAVAQTKSSEKPASKPVPKTNGFREEHNHRGNGYISITGHRAGEAAIAYEHGADIEALMPKLRHSEYFTDPKVQELAALERADSGYCRRVTDFVVGRKGYGHIKFLGETDVRRLDLENIVQFNKCEVLVYMDEARKPPVGQGLNKEAEVTLLNVKCVDKKTGQHHAEGPEVEKFEKRLRKKTEEQGAVFLGYDGPKGEWRFRVKHFSQYGLDLEEDNTGGNEEGAPVVAGFLSFGVLRDWVEIWCASMNFIGGELTNVAFTQVRLYSHSFGI